MINKRKRGKRRLATHDEEARAWRRVFLAGIDHAGELRAFGITTQAEMEAAAGDAWRRFGSEWLRTSVWRALPTAWAVQRFGRPPGAPVAGAT